MEAKYVWMRRKRLGLNPKKTDGLSFFGNFWLWGYSIVSFNKVTVSHSICVQFGDFLGLSAPIHTAGGVL